MYPVVIDILKLEEIEPLELFCNMIFTSIMLVENEQNFKCFSFFDFHHSQRCLEMIKTNKTCFKRNEPEHSNACIDRISQLEKKSIFYRCFLRSNWYFKKFSAVLQRSFIWNFGRKCPSLSLSRSAISVIVQT